MLESFEASLNRAERHQGTLAVLMIDIDHFKMFNDKFGHEAGDLVLKEVATAFKENFRLEDIACRYGGEEFLIICPDTPLRDGFLLGEKIRKLIAKLQLNLEETELSTISLSIGVAAFPNHGNTTQKLLAESDKALYSAKSCGRNGTVVAQANKRN
jgi:diguanylate cyclase (GGDEF)-like protein